MEKSSIRYIYRFLDSLRSLEMTEGAGSLEVTEGAGSLEMTEDSKHKVK